MELCGELKLESQEKVSSAITAILFSHRKIFDSNPVTLGIENFHSTFACRVITLSGRFTPEVFHLGIKEYSLPWQKFFRFKGGVNPKTLNLRHKI
jgi:hypothetical protein